MIDDTEARDLVSDWQRLSRIRGFLHIWAGRVAPDAPLVVRSAAVEAIREYSDLVKHLQAERQTVIDQLAAYDQERVALLDDVMGAES